MVMKFLIEQMSKPSNYLKFNLKYFSLAVVLFLTEVVIELYVHDNFVRPYIGDLLVVILLYCMVKSVLNTPVFITAISVLLFSYLIEILQYLNLTKMLGLENSYTAKILLGNYFAWEDIFAYTAGILIVLIFERKKLSSTFC